MPCVSYESNYSTADDSRLQEMQKINDRLARIACKVMTALEKEGKEDFILLQDDEVREWVAAQVAQE